MRCFDCRTDHRQDQEASAICATCGAALCTDHAVEGYAEERAPFSLGNPGVHRVEGRRIYCRTCAPSYLEPAASTRHEAELVG